jgi:hypothetical protein
LKSAKNGRAKVLLEIRKTKEIEQRQEAEENGELTIATGRELYLKE